MCFIYRRRFAKKQGIFFFFLRRRCSVQHCRADFPQRIRRSVAQIKKAVGVFTAVYAFAMLCSVLLRSAAVNFAKAAAVYVSVYGQSFFVYVQRFCVSAFVHGCAETGDERGIYAVGIVYKQLCVFLYKLSELLDFVKAYVLVC